MQCASRGGSKRAGRSLLALRWSTLVRGIWPREPRVVEEAGQVREQMIKGQDPVYGMWGPEEEGVSSPGGAGGPFS